MEKNRKLMKNLVDISVMVTQSTNFFEIKDKIVDKMLEVIEPTKACINLFYDNNFKNAYLVCSSTLDYIPKMFPKNSRIGTKLDFNESYPEYIHEAVRDKKIIYVENIFEDGQWAILEWRDPLGLRGCGFFHVVNGKILFQRGYWDKLSFLKQHNLPIE